MDKVYKTDDKLQIMDATYAQIRGFLENYGQPDTVKESRAMRDLVVALAHQIFNVWTTGTAEGVNHGD